MKYDEPGITDARGLRTYHVKTNLLLFQFSDLNFDPHLKKLWPTLPHQTHFLGAIPKTEGWLFPSIVCIYHTVYHFLSEFHCPWPWLLYQQPGAFLSRVDRIWLGSWYGIRFFHNYLGMFLNLDYNKTYFLLAPMTLLLQRFFFDGLNKYPQIWLSNKPMPCTRDVNYSEHVKWIFHCMICAEPR